MKRKDPYNYVQVKGRTIPGVSKTIPDQSLSIRELVEQFARGGSVAGRTPVYDGDEDDGIDYRNLDLAEQQAYREANKAKIEELTKDLQSRSADRRKKAEDKMKELMRKQFALEQKAQGGPTDES